MKSGYKKGTVTFKDRDVSSDNQVQNVPSARVYVFGDGDVDEDEINNEEVEMPAMRSRGSGTNLSAQCKPKGPEMELIERPIKEGDTLQNIALRYRVQVAELKRVNHLIRDQDFYALQTIKVPIQAHGLLSEIIAKEKADGQLLERPISNGAAAAPRERLLSGDIGSETDYDLNSESEETKRLLVVRTLSIRDSLRNSSQSKEAQDFLCRMDADINRIVQSTSSTKDSLEDVAASLTTKTILPFQGQQKKSLWGSGDDCGIRWWSMVGVMFLIGFITPILIIFYLTSHHHQLQEELPTATSSTVSPTSTPTVVGTVDGKTLFGGDSPSIS